MDKLIYDTARSQGIPDSLAKLIVAQAKHESNDYKSNVFKKNNNFFGYKYVGQKIAKQGTPAPASEGDFYALYKSPNDSIIELTNWIKRRVKDGKFPKDLASIDTPEEYAVLLKKAGYYGASLATYTNALKRWLTKINIAATATGAILIGALFFFC